MFRHYCLNCNNFFGSDIPFDSCPHCNSVGDDIELCEDTEEEEEEYDEEEYLLDISNAIQLIGAQ
jgi:hypothetical protein